MEIYIEHYHGKMLVSVTIAFTLITFASYMSLVIFALYISGKVGVLLTSVIVSLPSIIRAFSGLITPKIENVFGKKRSLLFAICIMAISYMLYVIAREWKGLILVSILCGFAELLYQPIIKSIFAQSAKDDSGTEFVHRIRYLSICMAGLLGPIIGGWISTSYGNEVCLHISSGLFIAGIIPILFIPQLPNDNMGEKVSENTDARREAMRSKKLWTCIISGALIYLVFSQFESVYSLALDTVYQNPAVIYSLLLSLNSLFGIMLQIYSIFRSRRNKKNYSIKQGIVFFQLGFVLFAIAFGAKSLPIFIIGVFVYSIGEVITIPGLDIQIDKFAPSSVKSAYFSLAEFRTIGFVLGPIVMSWMLEEVGAVFSCVFSVVLLAFAFIINLFPLKKILHRNA